MLRATLNGGAAGARHTADPAVVTAIPDVCGTRQRRAAASRSEPPTIRQIHAAFSVARAPATQGGA